VSLSPGSRFGSYEIQSPLGAGGMGEFYRATDTTLRRQVAIKVLLEAFAQDAERLARFEREARTLASLNHPQIAQVYGFERAGASRALVMELVEGPTLADRMRVLSSRQALEAPHYGAPETDLMRISQVPHTPLKTC
jgi:serine/threonine protein kinase